MTPERLCTVCKRPLSKCVEELEWQRRINLYTSDEKSKPTQSGQLRPNIGGTTRPSISDEVASTTWANAGGAKRSAPMLPWNMIWWGALRGMLTRFEIGLKYGYQNWKRALGVPRVKWHDGEPGPGHPTDESTLGFVRQFKAHADEHWFQATQLMDLPDGATSPKGDTLADNLYAWLWNVGCAVEYFCENPDLFREAFSKWPVDSPFHRVDYQQQKANHEATETSPVHADIAAMLKAEMETTLLASHMVFGDYEVRRLR